MIATSVLNWPTFPMIGPPFAPNCTPLTLWYLSFFCERRIQRFLHEPLLCPKLHFVAITGHGSGGVDGALYGRLTKVRAADANLQWSKSYGSGGEKPINVSPLIE